MKVFPYQQENLTENKLWGQGSSSKFLLVLNIALLCTQTHLYKNAYIAHNGLNNFIFSNEYFSFYDNKY